MKKAAAMIVTIALLVPAFCWAKGEALKESISRIADIDLSEIRENGNQLSTTVDLTTIDGKKFMIAIGVDKQNMIATFTFASGKMVIVTPAGIDVVEGQGYQDCDDVDNTIHIEPSVSNTCLLNVIGYLILPYPINLICLLYAYIVCF